MIFVWNCLLIWNLVYSVMMVHILRSLCWPNEPLLWDASLELRRRRCVWQSFGGERLRRSSTGVEEFASRKGSSWNAYVSSITSTFLTPFVHQETQKVSRMKDTGSVASNSRNESLYNINVYWCVCIPSWMFSKSYDDYKVKVRWDRKRREKSCIIICFEYIIIQKHI
jgi:hypothetical protein